MKRINWRLDRSDAIWFGTSGAGIVGYSAFFGKQIALGGAFSVAVILLMIVGMALAEWL